MVNSFIKRATKGETPIKRNVIKLKIALACRRFFIQQSRTIAEYFKILSEKILQLKIKAHSLATRILR